VPEKLENEVFSASPQLKHLTVYEVNRSSVDFPFWSKLQFLDMKHGLDSKLFNDLIPHLGELEILEGCPLHWPDNSTPEITLAKLTTLGVFGGPQCLHKLRLPALLRLSVDEFGARMETSGEPSISLPGLEILKLNVETSSSWLTTLSVPSLRVLTMFVRERSPSGEVWFQNIHLPTVQDFTLTYPGTDQVIISVLK